MKKQTKCSIARIIVLAVTFTVLREMYQMGWIGYLMVSMTALVWSVTSFIEGAE